MSGIVVLVNILLNLWFIPIWGEMGAAISSSIAYTLAAVMCYFFLRHFVKVPITQTLLINKEDRKKMAEIFQRWRQGT